MRVVGQDGANRAERWRAGAEDMPRRRGGKAAREWREGRAGGEVGVGTEGSDGRGVLGRRGRRWLGRRAGTEVAGAEAEVVGAEGGGGSGRGLGGGRRRRTWSGRTTVPEVVGVEDGGMGIR